MNKQIFLNGSPSVGFGENTGLSNLNPPLIGFLAGATGGAIVGALVGKGVGAIVGAIAGTIGGGAIGFAITDARATKTTADVTGAIFTIGLSGVPTTARVDDVGNALAQAMGWNLQNIEDGALKRDNNGNAALTFGFKSGVQTPKIPTSGFAFKVQNATVTVTYVAQAPARVT